MELNIEQLRSWIGREETRHELVTPSLVERFNATFDHEGDTANDAVAPLLIHLCLTQPAALTSRLGPDGHPARGGFLPPVPLPRRMWAGGAFTFRDDIRVGDIVTRTSRIQDVVVKEGRTGTLCFVTVGHEFHSNGRHAVTERQDIVYRGADMSALTFNGHRIHYDAPYVRNVENYPGLIVHGPMQATMLVRFATEIRGKPPVRFDFRSLSPLFDDADFTLNAIDDGEGLKLWTSYANGPVAMEARALW